MLIFSNNTIFRRFLLNLLILSVAGIFLVNLPVFSQGIENPLGESDPRVILGRVIKVVLGLTGTIGLIMFIYGGLAWMTAGGKKEQVKKGSDTMVWAILGLAVIFASYAIVDFVLTKLTGTGG
ncbi:MAG: hypothetical protein HY973_00180 [Candidatus Kerfeldbacteria bacterium]|nr:hypothetical protein [Candidatus Kerfeldbacteria bacterium]